jgi:hypothetical protein
VDPPQDGGHDVTGAEPVGADVLEILQGICRWLVGSSFIVAGVRKLQGYESFAAVLRKFPIARTIFGGSASSRAAVTLSVIEIALGTMFFVGLLVTLTGGLLLVLLFLFTGASLIVLVHGEQVECGCFGETGTPVRTATIFRNLGLAAATLLGTIGATTAVFPWTEGPFPQTLMLLLLALESFAIVLAFVEFRRLRATPHFVTHVPSGETQTDVWAGIREKGGMSIHG